MLLPSSSSTSVSGASASVILRESFAQMKAARGDEVGQAHAQGFGGGVGRDQVPFNVSETETLGLAANRSTRARFR